MIPIERSTNFHFTISHIVINFSIRYERLFFMSFKSLFTFFDFKMIANVILWMCHSFIYLEFFFELKNGQSFHERYLFLTIVEKKHTPKLLHFDYFTNAISDLIFRFMLNVRIQVHVSVPHHLRISFDRSNAKIEQILSDSDKFITFVFLFL